MKIIDCSRYSYLSCVQETPAEKGNVISGIAVEHGMDLWLNEQPAMHLTCTPQHLDELVVGRLLTEGWIQRVEQIETLYICDKGLLARVTVSADIASSLKKPETESVGTCCTDNRLLLEKESKTPSTVLSIQWNEGSLKKAVKKMHQEQKLYELTHAVHACALIMEDHLLCCREDIGRHNALDKVIGWALLSGLDLHTCMLFSTGRLPADMVLKAVRAGIPLLASKTYPTDRGLEIAQRTGLTLITIRPEGACIPWNGGSGGIKH